MKTTLLMALTAAGLLTLGGCNKAESPAKVQNDVAKAADSAADQDAKAKEKQADTDAAANKDLATAEQKSDVKTTDAAADTVVTQAEGDNKVALAKCESLSGTAHQACKDKANALLDLAKAKAKAMKANHG